VNWLQTIVCWLAKWVGVMPAVSRGLVEQAQKLAQEVETTHKRECGEYRRHLVFKRLVEGGASPRAAAVAIEIAVHSRL
jgi:hypothetical protein